MINRLADYSRRKTLADERCLHPDDLIQRGGEGTFQYIERVIDSDEASSEMMMNWLKRYSPIPRWMNFLPHGNDRIILSYLLFRERLTKGGVKKIFSVTIREMVEELEMNERTVRRSVARFTEMKLLVIEGRKRSPKGGTPYHYRFDRLRLLSFVLRYIADKEAKEEKRRRDRKDDL